jgi:hypothetical protein
MAFEKDPGEVKDYAVDWSARLVDGDTISTSTFTVPTGIIEPEEPATATTATVATVWLSGGTAGVDYRVTNHIVTAQGREFERSFTVSVQEL